MEPYSTCALTGAGPAITDSRNAPIDRQALADLRRRLTLVMAGSPLNDGPDHDTRRAEGQEQPASVRDGCTAGRSAAVDKQGLT